MGSACNIESRPTTCQVLRPLVVACGNIADSESLLADDLLPSGMPCPRPPPKAPVDRVHRRQEDAGARCEVLREQDQSLCARCSDGAHRAGLWNRPPTAPCGGSYSARTRLRRVSVRVYVEISELCARGFQSGSHTNPSSGRGELRAARGPVRGRNAESFEGNLSGLR